MIYDNLDKDFSLPVSFHINIKSISNFASKTLIVIYKTR